MVTARKISWTVFAGFECSIRQATPCCLQDGVDIMVMVSSAGGIRCCGFKMHLELVSFILSLKDVLGIAEALVDGEACDRST